MTCLASKLVCLDAVACLAGSIATSDALALIEQIEQVLIVDGDNVRLLQPEELFQSLQYRVRRGCLGPSVQHLQLLLIASEKSTPYMNW